MGKTIFEKVIEFRKSAPRLEAPIWYLVLTSEECAEVAGSAWPLNEEDWTLKGRTTRAGIDLVKETRSDCDVVAVYYNVVLLVEKPKCCECGRIL